MKSIEHDENQKRTISNQQSTATSPPMSWDSTNGSDVYKEKWFHGKISRDEVEKTKNLLILKKKTYVFFI